MNKACLITLASNLVLATTGFASAQVACNGKALITLSEKKRACVVSITTTEITMTQSVTGAGPATARASKSEVGVVALRMLDEQTAKAVSRNALHRRARAICESYKSRVMSLVKKPSNPFMVVVMGWGNTQKSPLGGRRSPNYREFFLNQSCRVKLEQ